MIKLDSFMTGVLITYISLTIKFSIILFILYRRFNNKKKKEIFDACEKVSQEYQKRIRENYILKTEINNERTTF